jgi:hypothetical protein
MLLVTIDNSETLALNANGVPNEIRKKREGNERLGGRMQPSFVAPTMGGRASAWCVNDVTSENLTYDEFFSMPSLRILP